MSFYELPFKAVDEFDYPAIAKMVNEDGRISSGWRWALETGNLYEQTETLSEKRGDDCHGGLPLSSTADRMRSVRRNGCSMLIWNLFTASSATRKNS